MIGQDLADRLCAVDGVVAVALGGSRARGDHRPDSDWDLGLYYRGTPDLAGLRAVAASIADGPLDLTAPGGWGPWVDGGGWLRVDGVAVDWIYRDLDRVHRVWADCRAGRYTVEVQAGHPLGFYSHAYAGEVALGRVLGDPTGELTALRAETVDYPPALGAALVAGGWETGLLLDGAAKGAAGGDAGYVAGCLFRVVGVLVPRAARPGRTVAGEREGHDRVRRAPAGCAAGLRRAGAGAAGRGGAYPRRAGGDDR
nr:nucleotidyltransferase domain-containing protein [Micromonospora provocatoris]